MSVFDLFSASFVPGHTLVVACGLLAWQLEIVILSIGLLFGIIDKREVSSNENFRL